MEKTWNREKDRDDHDDPVEPEDQREQGEQEEPVELEDQKNEDKSIKQSQGAHSEKEDKGETKHNEPDCRSRPTRRILKSS